MRIRMVGIDHSKAALEYREAFSFTKAGIRDALKNIKNEFHVSGCLILSTCNRTELWVSGESDITPYEILCKVKKMDKEYYEEFFTKRQGKEAIRHILNVVCGFDSKIFGEDQIISQVRESLQLSRESECADVMIEKIFQSALAAGKKVKTDVFMNNINESAADDVEMILKKRIGNIKNKNCLVIGNGKMGKLVASKLVSCGANVSMTLRRKFHGSDKQQSIMPVGCHMISYDDRVEEIKKSDVIVSATVSPHFTLNFEETKEKFTNSKYYIFDLAVPRDIDPEIGKLDCVELFDIDTMGSSNIEDANSPGIERARAILNECEDKLESWLGFREYVPKIQEITDLVVEDASFRFAGVITREETKEEKDLTVTALEDVVRKATSKLLYGLRETLPREIWNQCFFGLHEAAAKDTMKH